MRRVVATLQNGLDTAKHGSAAPSLGDSAVRSHIGFNVQMAFDSGDGVYDYFTHR